MTRTASFTKTSSGEWVVVGPTWIVKPGAVQVTKRDGTTKTEQVVRIGRSFARDGVEQCYGYLAAKPAARPTGGHSGRFGQHAPCPTDGNCWSFASVDHCWHCGK